MSLRLRRTVLLVAASVSALTAAARAENWPEWRGPTRDGICTETSVPTTWSKTENVLWRTPLPGRAGATPVVWNDRIFLTTAGEDNNSLYLMCLGTDGKERWKKLVGTGNKDARDTEGNSASPSPSTDGKHVWVFFGTGILGCYDVDGNEVWKFDLQPRYGKFIMQFGVTTTPILDGDRLYMQLIHGDYDQKTREAVVICLDKLTGNQIWKQDRFSTAYAENEQSYASPFLYRDGRSSFLLSHGADCIVAHDLGDGHELWRSYGLQPAKYDEYMRMVPSPVAAPGLIIAPSAARGRVLALKPGGTGDITGNSDFKYWEFGTTPDVPSPLIYDGIVYLYRENGVLVALDAKTGAKLYEQRTRAGGNRASPILANGNLYVTARDATVTVIKAGPQFQEVALNQLDESITASPVVSNGRIYLRTFEALWAIGKRESGK